MSFPLIACNGIVSSRPRDRRIVCILEGNVFILVPRGAASLRLKFPSILTISYAVGSERGPARANL